MDVGVDDLLDFCDLVPWEDGKSFPVGVTLGRTDGLDAAVGVGLVEDGLEMELTAFFDTEVNVTGVEPKAGPRSN